jgi:uncharacterized protein (TIRG00374 family)
MKKIISLITIITITVATLTYALWDINFADLGQLLSGGDYRILIPFLAILVLFYWMKAVRWVLILRPVGEFTRKQVTPSLVIGFAANNVLPAHLGELIRIALFARQYKKPVSSITISLLVERIFDLVAILSFYALSIALIDTPPESLEIGAWLVVVLLAGILVSIAIVLYRPDLLHRLADRIGHLLPGETGTHLTHMLDNIIVGADGGYDLAVATGLWHRCVTWHRHDPDGSAGTSRRRTKCTRLCWCHPGCLCIRTTPVWHC